MLKFVGYYSEFSHNGGERGLMMKEIYYRRAVKVNYSSKTNNFEIDVGHFEELLKKDL